MDIVINSESMGYIRVFEQITKTSVKDVIVVQELGKIVFVVVNGQLRKAIGKKGENIKRLRERFKKNVDIVEYSPEPIKFIENIFHDFKVKEVRLEESRGNMVAYVVVETKDKGRAIGKDGRNLKLARLILSRHHDGIETIRIS
jgi:N utilization substance protein A